MNVGLNLVGTIGPEAQDDLWITEVEAWFRKHCVGTLVSARYTHDALGRRFLFLRLHPLAPGMKLLDLGEGKLQVVADTAPVGPGYHVFLCETLRKLSLAFDICWEATNSERGLGDPTGYFETGDEMQLYRLVLDWFREQAVAALVHVRDSGSATSLLLPEQVVFTHDGVVATPMGPRGIEWLELVSKKPAHAIPVFPWWQPGQGARSHLARALGQMWTDVRWRPPVTDGERGSLVEISHLLEQAMEGDTNGLAIPWREWSEILRYIDASGPLVEHVASQAEGCSGPLVGYRRRPVRRTLLGGWSIEVPGSFAEKWEDRSTWVAWEEDRSIWVTSFANRTGQAPEIPEHLSLDHASASWGEVLDYQHERILGSAVLDRAEEDGMPVWQLQTRSAVAGHLAVATICFTEEEQRSWAMRTWRSITHETVPEERRRRPVLPELSDRITALQA